MRDDAQYTRPPSSGVSEDVIRRLANRAIDMLAENGGSLDDAASERIAGFAGAFISTDEEERHDALLHLRQDGVAAGDIIDHVIPAAARLMGEQWTADMISFVDVTIGSARLQETVHALATRNAVGASVSSVETQPCVLIIVPRGEQHTLGPCVLADQFRRVGYQPTILVDCGKEKIAQELGSNRFALVGISTSSRRTLASVRELVDFVHSHVTYVAPIVVGGTLLDRMENVLEFTGADYVASSAKSALHACGLPILTRPEFERPKSSEVTS